MSTVRTGFVQCRHNKRARTMIRQSYQADCKIFPSRRPRGFIGAHAPKIGLGLSSTSSTTGRNHETNFFFISLAVEFLLVFCRVLFDFHVISFVCFRIRGIVRGIGARDNRSFFRCRFRQSFRCTFDKTFLFLHRYKHTRELATVVVNFISICAFWRRAVYAT